MARDRKRAKQRRARQPAAQRSARRPADEGATPTPDPLEHASAEADIAEAAIAGADAGEWEPEGPLKAEELPQPDELEDEDGELEDGAAPAPARRAPRHREEHRQGNRVVNFLRACWAELQRVQWPDRRQVIQATAVVIGFVAVAGAYLGALDAVFSRLVDAII